MRDRTYYTPAVLQGSAHRERSFRIPHGISPSGFPGTVDPGAANRVVSSARRLPEADIGKKRSPCRLLCKDDLFLYEKRARISISERAFDKKEVSG